MTSIDELSEALFAGYTAASQRLSGDRDRALRELLDDLLAGRHSSPGALADRSRELRVSLPAQPFVLVAEPIDPATAATEAAADEIAFGLAHADPAGPTRYLVTSRERRLVLLMPPGDRAALDRAVAARGWRGCLIAGQPVTQAALAYRLASDSLDTAPAHAFDHGGLLTDGDAHILALLAARLPVTPAEVARTVLGPLAEPRHGHLLDGLDAFLAAGTATAAADQLHLHPQTMRYRLRRARELTGRDPRLPWQRLVLDVARHLVQISAPVGPASPTR
jgi:sugar diacid utilization regulator